MARGAAYVLMLAEQWKSGLCVVEFDLLPTLNVVAGLAVRPKRPFVRIVGLMAFNACRRRIAKLAAGGVTVPAFDARMPARERIIGQRMVKPSFVKRGDVEGGAFMLSMAGLAWDVINGGGLSVETLGRLNVSGDRFVA